MAARKAETETILDVLSYTRWNRSNTASLLMISYKALLNKIKEYEIEDRYLALVSPSTHSTSSGLASSGAQDRGQPAENTKDKIRWRLEAKDTQRI